jgi:hypothetical protein
VCVLSHAELSVAASLAPADLISPASAAIP